MSPSQENLMEGEHDNHTPQPRPLAYRVFKRRWFGLTQLVLLNIIISWNWLTFAAVSTTSSAYFKVSETAINWLSTAFLLSFVAMSPAVIWILNKGGPKSAMMIASGLTLVGNWIRYAGSRASGGHFEVVMFGQILIGLAQPLALCTPTRYSDLWFSSRGRVSATAVASLANPFGGALGQLIGPIWATKESEVPNMVLYTAIISSVASIPSIFVPAKPPTPASASSSFVKPPLSNAISLLSPNASFYLILVPFSVYVGFFNAFSSLLNQILEPYGYSESDAGICGALLIVVGLVFSALLSPVVDRTKAFVTTIKILVPIVGLAYLCFIFAPATRSLPAPYIISSFLGAASFALVPVTLEYLVEITWPVSPEVTSTICWAGGQLLGAIFILIMGELKGADGEPEGSMKRALIFQAVIACAVVPLPLALGTQRFGLGKQRRGGRLEIDAGSGNMYGLQGVSR